MHCLKVWPIIASVCTCVWPIIANVLSFHPRTLLTIIRNHFCSILSLFIGHTPIFKIDGVRTEFVIPVPESDSMELNEMQQPLEEHHRSLQTLLEQAPLERQKMKITHKGGQVVKVEFDTGSQAPEHTIYRSMKGSKEWTPSIQCADEIPVDLATGDVCIMLPSLPVAAIKYIAGSAGSVTPSDSVPCPIQRLSLTFFQVKQAVDGGGEWSLCGPGHKLSVVPWSDDRGKKVFPMGRASSHLGIKDDMTFVANKQAELRLKGNNSLSIASKSKRKTCVVRGESIFLLTGEASAELKPDDIIVSQTLNCRSDVDCCQTYFSVILFSFIFSQR